MNIKKPHKSKKLYIIIPLILILGVLIAMLVNYNQSIKAVTERTKENLSDSSKSQAKILKTSIENQYTILETFANEIASANNVKIEEIIPRLKTISESSSFIATCVSLPDGSTYSQDNRIINVSDREYFITAMNGERNIQKILKDRFDGSPGFIIAVPITKNGAQIGVIHGNYSESILRSLLVTEIHGYSGYSFVCAKNGDIVIGNNNESSLLAQYNIDSTGSKNLFDILKNAPSLKGYSEDQIKAALNKNEDGIITCEIEGSLKYVFFSPLNIRDWYIFNVVSGEFIETDAMASTRSNIYAIAIVILFSLFALVSIIVHEKRNIKEIKKEKEQIRISEELYRVAMSHTNSKVLKYDIKTHKLYLDEYTSKNLGIPEIIEDMPSKMIEKGIVDPESKDQFISFYKAMSDGIHENTCIIKINSISGENWLKMSSTVIFDSNHIPAYGVVSYEDITELREKEIAYEKWRMSISTMPQNKISLYEYNLSKNSFIREEGTLIHNLIPSDSTDISFSFDDLINFIAENFVFLADMQNFLRFACRKNLLDSYYLKNMFDLGFDFHLIQSDGSLRWTHMGVQMVPYSDSSDVKAFVLFQDIEERKQEQLVLMSRLTEDTLTKTLNRASFIEKVAAVLSENPTMQHALIIIDIDNFKYINDNFGHTAGDLALITISNNLKSVIRQNDLFGRIGGDEFMILIKDIPYSTLIEKRARQICDLMRKENDSGISVSGSLGIAVYPKDGTTFEELYKKSDLALYKAKQLGKNGFFIYNNNLNLEISDSELKNKSLLNANNENYMHSQAKKTMLIIDNDEISREILLNIFKNDFNIFTVKDTEAALKTIYKYRLGLSIVLLDIFMPGLNGIDLLKQVYQNKELSSIPFIVISGANEEKYSIEAIELGASDFISKPIEPKIVVLRVQNAINKMETEKLRLQNNYLLLQKEEEIRYRHVLETTGTIVFECNWSNKTYTYDSSASIYLAGKYDHRKLWDIFISDNVAQEEDTKKMQAMEFKIATGTQSSDKMNVRLRSATGELHWFEINISKLNDDSNTSSKLLITFNDINEEILANEKLVYKTQYDSLTNLYNRDTFLIKTQEMLTDKNPNSYIMIYFDIEKFKVINDIFGYSEGDRLLSYMGSKTSVFMEDNGGTACHISADYFAVCIPYSPSNLSIKLNKYIDEINNYDVPFQCSLNFGLYVIDDPSLPAETMLARAALAQRAIKRNNVKRYAFYNNTMRDALINEQSITGMMNDALHKHQFEIYLQPQYNLKTGQIIGSEALVRWIHPEKGFMSPDIFMPIFEKTGFISKVDEYVWEHVCKILNGWISSGKTTVPISVNVSRKDIYNPKLFRILMKLSEKYSIPSYLLKLEIKENSYLDNPDQFVSITKSLKNFGFPIEMDDFGTGYSSLNLLRDVDVNALKLNIMSLFRIPEETQSEENILKHIINMANDLNIGIIAKCVETKEQENSLLSLGCNFVQGYYYAKPMPVSSFEELINA
ncbi:MAG: EAL domain-containing protein [Lachnospiraceae bacterium]|nr:EAL domain-containing protein [Lachnospiraceae bacterium]